MCLVKQKGSYSLTKRSFSVENMMLSDTQTNNPVFACQWQNQALLLAIQLPNSCPEDYVTAITACDLQDQFLNFLKITII